MPCRLRSAEQRACLLLTPPLDFAVSETVVEETTATLAEQQPEQVVETPVQPADLHFIKPVTPELRTVSEQELQLE